MGSLLLRFTGFLFFLLAGTLWGQVADDFEGDGPLLGYTTNNPNSLPDVARVGGRYRANLVDNTNEITLHYHNDQGRLDAKLVSFPFTYIARNIGIGTQTDSQTAPNGPNRLFQFCGVQVHVADLNSRNSSHVVVGHRGFTKFTVEGKNTNNGNSTVNDDGANVLPLGRADIKVEGTESRELIVSWQNPNLTGDPGNDNFQLYNGTGDLPGPTPSYGEQVYIGLITYTFGSSSVPFVGTCDSIEFNGSGGGSSKIDPIITWNDPAPIVVGAVLGTTQLNATANVPGTFVYSPPSGSLLSVGTGQTLTVTFTPSDTASYNVVEATVVIDVIAAQKEDPVISWASPSPIVYGTPLAQLQLNATANVPGTFVYDPPVGALLSAGSAQTLSVTFTPNDTGVYNEAEATVSLDVNPANLELTAPSLIKTYGAPVPEIVVQAEGLVAGDTLEDLSVPPAVSMEASVSSVPGEYPITLSGASDPDYSISYGAGSLTIVPAPLTLQADSHRRLAGWPNPELTVSGNGFVLGQSLADLESLPLLATDAELGSPVGEYAISVSGALDSRYEISYVAGVLEVVSAAPTIRLGLDDERRAVIEIRASASSNLRVELSEDLVNWEIVGEVQTDASGNGTVVVSDELNGQQTIFVRLSESG